VIDVTGMMLWSVQLTGGHVYHRCCVRCSCVSATDIVVYFAKSVGLQLKVCDGQNLTATELFEYVMEEQNYPADARQLFSLWLVSDVLGMFVYDPTLDKLTLLNSLALLADLMHSCCVGLRRVNFCHFVVYCPLMAEAVCAHSFKYMLVVVLM